MLPGQTRTSSQITGEFLTGHPEAFSLQAEASPSVSAVLPGGVLLFGGKLPSDVPKIIIVASATAKAAFGTIETVITVLAARMHLRIGSGVSYALGHQAGWRLR